MNRAGIASLAAISLLAAGCGSTKHAAVPKPQSSRLVSERGTFEPAVPSRDGNRVAVVRHLGDAGSIEVGRAGGGPRRTVFRSDNGCCANVAWASRYVIAFDENFMVETIDLRTHRVRTLAQASEFNLSSDGRWVAWSRTGGPEAPDAVGVVSITGAECLPVPRPKNRADSLAFFHPDGKRVYFLREPYSAGSNVDGSGRTVSVALSSLQRAPRSACLR